MYAYIDESGNTGSNLFDVTQPTYLTAALMTRTNFDVRFQRKLDSVASKIGCKELHASIIGMQKIEPVAKDLLKIIKEADARFCVSRVEKKYLLVAKLVDVLFDSFENKAVPWHVYNLPELKSLLVIKVASILQEDVAKLFWSAIVEKKEVRSKEYFQEAIQKLGKSITMLSDQRSSALIGDAIKWASDNPEAINTHVSDKVVRLGHLPNPIAFRHLLDGIEDQSTKWKRGVTEIKHDRQGQFQKTLSMWHSFYTTKQIDMNEWPFGDLAKKSRLIDSLFVVSSATDSAGIQVIDTILWLLKQELEQKSLESNCSALTKHVFRKMHVHDLSFINCETILKSCQNFDMSLLSEQQVFELQKIRETLESNRLKEIEQHEIIKFG